MWGRTAEIAWREYLYFGLPMERYEEAIEVYEQALAEDFSLPREGLEAARLGQQPD